MKKFFCRIKKKSLYTKSRFGKLKQVPGRIVPVFLFLMPVMLFLSNGNLFAQQGSADSSGTIVIELSGFKNATGQLRASLFDQEDGFPGSYKKAVAYSMYDINDGSVRVIFRDVPFGEYAASFLHDENNNSKLDSNWLGIPKEGFAVSNNAKGRFGPPDYDDAKFKLNSDSLRLEVTINYF